MYRLIRPASCALRRCGIAAPQLRLLTPAVRLYSLEAVERTGEETEALRARLLYQSKKRGILENDIIIGDFGMENLKGMARDELEAYDKIINGDHMEWDLFYFMSGKKEPTQELKDSPMFNRIRNFVKAKQEASQA